MKRIPAWIAATAMILGLAGCRTATPPEIKDPDATAAPTTGGETGPTAAPTAVLQDDRDRPMAAIHYDWAEDLPRMDGSTSTIPLEAGIRAALFGTSIAEAELQVSHSTTYGSYYNLINGDCDLIFSVPLSPEQIAGAEEKGKALAMEKIAAEGFVFVVNAQNPVDTLSQQQLRDIYSGKITNWKEVGGRDAPILAYQRNETSGSQNFMHTFMGDTPLMDPLTCAAFTPSGMGELMDAVAYYDNAQNAIGYSVYAYAADMYGNVNEIKFIQVDGVAPAKAAMASGDYPLLGYNYAVYDSAAPADSSLRKLVAWLVTEEGQRAIQAAGYVPLRPVGEIPETVIDLYSALGTGPERPTGSAMSADRYVAYIYGENLKGLVNKELEEQINSFIAEAETDAGIPDFTCVNGYLSVAVGARTALYDLVAGKQIPFSDLFFKGEEFVSLLNQQLYDQINASSLDFTEDYEDDFLSVDSFELKRLFVGIPAGHGGFTLDSVLFAEDLYFDRLTALSFSGLQDKMVTSRARDMADLFDGTVEVVRELNLQPMLTKTQSLVMDHFGVDLLDGRYYDKALCETVNGRIRREMAEGLLSREGLTERYRRVYGLGPDEEMWAEAGGGALYTLGSDLICFSAFVWSRENTGITLLFDAATGEEIPYTALLKEGWESRTGWYEPDTDYDPFYLDMDQARTLEAPAAIDRLTLFSIDTYWGRRQLEFGTDDPAHPHIYAVLAEEDINWDV